MSLREKRPGYWEVRVYAGTDPVSGKRGSVARGVRGTKRDAKRLEATLLHEVAERPVTETEGTLLFACNQVIDHLEQIGRSPTTIDSYRQLADGRIAERIGAIRLCDLTTRDIDGCYASMSAEGVSPSRIEKCAREVVGASRPFPNRGCWLSVGGRTLGSWRSESRTSRTTRC